MNGGLRLDATNAGPGAALPPPAVGHVAGRHASREAPNLEWEAQSTAAILDLVEKVHEAGDVMTACQTLATELQAHLGCDRVAIGVRRGEAGPCRLMAVSGVAQIDPRSDVARSMEAALDESILRDAVTTWAVSESQASAPVASYRRLASLTSASNVLGAPLRTAAGSTIGAWVFLWTRPIAGHSQHDRFLQACSPSVAGAVRVLKQFEPWAIRRCAQRLARSVPLLRGRALGALIAVLAAACFTPMPHIVSVECEVRPVVRRFVAAPFAGEFEKSLVKPGDVVTRGQVLGRIEGRDVRWELAGLSADQQRVRKSRDANMAVGKTAAAQMDQLEAERLDVKRKLLESRLQHLEVRSPIDGIVISGDLERSEGVPVAMGQILFEVAPLASMVAELAIPDAKIPHVEAGMPATLRLNAFPGTAWTGSVAKIHPRSVTREKDNVFLGDVPLDNHDRTLRPGMKGRARIRTANRALGWIVFHEPWHYVVSRLGW